MINKNSYRWIDKRIEKLGDVWQYSFSIRSEDLAKEMDDNYKKICEEYELDYDEDDYDNYDYDTDAYAKKAYPGFLLVFCNNGTNKEELILELEKTVQSIMREIDIKCDKIIDDGDTEGVWGGGIKDHIIIGEKIYFDISTYCDVDYGSGEICQLFLDINEHLACGIKKVLDQYDIKYAGQFRTEVHDNYFADICFLTVTNIFQINH